MVTAALVLAVVSVSATTAAVIAAVATFAISFTASYLIAKSISVSSAVDSSSYSQLVQEDVVAQRVIYGKRQVSMVLSYLHEEDGTQSSGELLYMVGMVTNHEVESISDFYLDDTLVSSIPTLQYVTNPVTGNVSSSGVMNFEHVNGTGDIPDWLLELDNYDADMTGSTGYWIAMRIKFNSDYFTSLPTPTVVVEGRNKILDFRDGQYKYTNNAALVIADFYMNYMNIDQDRLIMTGSGSFIDAANLCDEIMDTGEARYTINGMFELDQKPSDILNEMLKSCGGTLVRQAGLIGLLPAAFYGPSNFTVNESMVSSISISPEQPTSDAVNVMTGTFVSPDDEWADQDFTPLTDEDAIARDGQEITDDITYSFVTNSMQAQRLANIELRRRTAAGFTELTMSPLGAYCRVGRVVTIDLPQVAINGSYRVTSQTENEDQTFTVSLQRDDQAIYDDAVGEPYVPAPILSTGSNTVPAPTSLTFTTDNNVGNEIQGILSWTANSSSIAYFEVVVTDATTDEVVQSGETTANSFNLNAFELGSYEANVRSVNRRGATSAYATVTFSVGTPSEVDSVTVNRSNWNIELIPNISGGTPQGTLFEFYYLADPESYITSQPTYDSTAQGLSELITTSSSLNKGSLTPDRWQHFWVRSINSYGVSSFVYVQTGTTRESELVTTVVERLVAIEIESQNWDDDAGTGYKLFSPDSDPYTMPDGTVLTNPDGLAVLNNAVIKGHMTAESLTFVDSDAIPAEIDNVNAVATAVQDSEDYVNANFVDSVTYGTDIAAIQAQIDKSITSWFYEGVPTLTNEPAVNWTTDADKDVQLGDLYYATDTGYSYRFTYSGGVYSWVQLSDSDITLALATANAAQDTADSKRRVFYATPVPPYDEGDLWDTGDGLKRCQTASTTTYSASHWIDATDGAGAAAAALSDANSYTEGRIYPDQDNLQIQGNYSQGVSGWAIDSDGTAEFNDVVIRGSGYFEGDITGSNGTFSGEVFADKISGGIYDTKYFTGADTSVPGTEGETRFFLARIVNSLGVERSFFPGSQSITIATEATGTIHGWAIRVMVGTTQVYYEVDGTNIDDTGHTVSIPIITIPAGVSGVISYYLDITDWQGGNNASITWNTKPLKAELFITSGELT